MFIVCVYIHIEHLLLVLWCIHRQVLNYLREKTTGLIRVLAYVCKKIFICLFTYLLLLMLVVFGLHKALFHPLKIAGENVLNLS